MSLLKKGEKSKFGYAWPRGYSFGISYGPEFDMWGYSWTGFDSEEEFYQSQIWLNNSYGDDILRLQKGDRTIAEIDTINETLIVKKGGYSTARDGSISIDCGLYEYLDNLHNFKSLKKKSAMRPG